MWIRCLSLFFALGSIAGTCAAAVPPGDPEYDKDIAPILWKYCVSCHNPRDHEGKLDLESFEALKKGGAHGPVVVAEKPEESKLYTLLLGKTKPVMPPEGNEAPQKTDIQLLRIWIALGAPGGRGLADPTTLVVPKVKLTTPARNAIATVAVSPSGTQAALGAYGEVRLLAIDEQAIAHTLSGVRGSVTDLEYSRDGKLLAVAAGEPGLFGEALLYTAPEGRVFRTFTGHRDSLYAVALSADAKTLATASYDQTIKLWDVATNKELKTLAGHNGAVYDLSFNPAGTILASCGADRTVKLWDVKTGARLDTFSQSTKELYAVAFSPDGKHVVAGGADNRIRLWTISPTAKENTNPLVITRFAHEGAVLKLAYSADGKTLVSSGEDKLVRLWNPATIMETRALEKQPDWVAGLGLTADGKTLVVGRMDGTYGVFDAATAKLKPVLMPQLASATVEPRGVQRGKSVKVVLRGTALLGVTRVELRSPEGKVVGTSDYSSPDRSSTELTYNVTAAEKLPRGEYTIVAVAGKADLAAPKSGPLTVNVDELVQITEQEPNDLAKRSAVILQNTGTWGICSRPGDVDHFRFAAKKGETIVARLEAKPLGSMLNGFLTLLDPAGETIASNNDFDGSPDPLVNFTVPADGEYAVRVSDQAMAGSPQHFYRLSVGTMPLATGVFPQNVTVGRESEVQLSGFNLPPKFTTKVKPAAAGETNVAVDGEWLRTTKPLKVMATADVETVELEPNDVPAATKPVATPAFVAGRISSPGASGADVDLIRFASKKGQTWIIETEAGRRGSPLDTKIEVLDAAGKPVPRVLLQAVRDSYVTFRSVDSLAAECRFFNWEEMELNEYAYMSGEVVKLFRKPRGPDSGFEFYQSAGRRRGYFDTSAAGHALDEAVYIVEPHPIGTKLVYNGLPTFTLNYANDDDGLRKLGGDSRLTFTAPADGEFLVRVSDVRGFGGERYFYRLTIREPKPDFTVALANAKPILHAGSGATVTFNAERIDDFDDEIAIDVAGLPEGYTLSQPVTIQAGHNSAKAVLSAAPTAKPVADDVWKKVKWNVRAKVAGNDGAKDVVKPMDGFTSVALEEKPKLTVKLEPAELTIAPGQTISATLKIERHGFTDRMNFDVLNLPHGVIVADIGLNGILIPAGQSERQIFITCFDWVPETERLTFAQTLAAKSGGPKVDFESSNAVKINVRKPSSLVRADAAPVAPQPTTGSPTK